MKDKWKRYWMGYHLRKAARLKLRSNRHLYRSETLMVELQISHGIEPMVKLPDGKVISYDLQNVDEGYDEIYDMWPVDEARLH